MQILVIGNINSGKTTFCQKLLKLFPNYRYLAIDDYRKKYADYSLPGELRARQKFIDDFLMTKDAIIEFAGGGPIGEALYSQLTTNSLIVLVVDTPVTLCIERIAGKDFSQIPYPQFDEKIDETIIRINHEIHNGLYQRLWGKAALKIYTIRNHDDLEAIPLLHYHYLFELIEVVQKQLSTAQLFAFGSLGRGELTPLSDIDLFLLTKDNINEVYTQIKQSMGEFNVSLMKNQINLRNGNLLIELVIIRSLEEGKYYLTSVIKDAAKTVLLGPPNLQSDLQTILDNHDEPLVEELTYIQERLWYFVLSLPRIIKRHDDYKYFFHTNIIIHELIRYRAITGGHPEFNYLPKQAKKWLSPYEWEILLYDFKKDKEAHAQTIKELVSKELKLAIYQ